MLDSMRGETYSSFRHMYALASVACCNIKSVYPKWKNPFVKRNDLNVTISLRVKTENIASILWSHNRYWFRKGLAAKPYFSFDPWTTHSCGVKPNKTQPIWRKCNMKNFFAQMPSSKSTEKKAEVTLVLPPKRIKKAKKVKKEGEGNT